MYPLNFPNYLKKGTLDVPPIHYTVKKIKRFLDFFDQTSLGLGLGKLFTARESLVTSQLGTGIAEPSFTVYIVLINVS